jgi:peptide/nickel transport system permease protein
MVRRKPAGQTRLIYGARISLYVGFGAVLLGSVLATAVGILSAYYGGRVDMLVQRAVDAWMAFPRRRQGCRP